MRPGDPAHSVRFRESVASVLLDAARGLAAVLVLLDHTHNLLFVDAEEGLRWAAATGGGWKTALMWVGYALTSAGREAVVLFFVLSGLLVGGSVLRALEEDRFRWNEYLVHRLVRLWLVLGPALVLGIGWDAATAGLDGHGMAAFWRAMLLHAPDRRLTWGLFWGNLTFLQTIRVPMLGTNRVLWTLACEFWYYVLFALGAVAMSRRQSGLQRCVCAGVLIAVAVFVGKGVLGLFPVWLLGVWLARIKPWRVGVRGRWVAGAMFAAAFFGLAMVSWTSRWFKPDYVLGLLTVVWLRVLLGAREHAKPQALWVRGSRWLGSFSYSLYLVHFPPLFLFTRVVLAGGLWLPDVRHLLLGAGVVAAVVGYAWAVAWATEFRNGEVRAFVLAQERLHSRTGFTT